VVKHPIHLFTPYIELVLAIGLEGYGVTRLNSLGHKIIIWVTHYPHQRLFCQRLEYGRLLRRYRANKTKPVVRVPIAIPTPHIELVEVY